MSLRKGIVNSGKKSMRFEKKGANWKIVFMRNIGNSNLGVIPL